MGKKLTICIITLFTLLSVKSQTPANDSSTEEIIKLNQQVVQFYQENKLAEALPLAKKVAELSEKKYGSGTLELAKSLGNLGYILSGLSEDKSAENTFGKAIKIYKKIPNLEKADSESFVRILEAVAIIKHRREFITAEDDLEEAALWREKISGIEAKELANTYYLLGNISYWKKDYKKSADRFYKVLELIEKNKNISSEEANMAYYQCRCSYVKAGKSDQLESLEKRFEANTDPALAIGLIKKKSDILNAKALNLIKPSYPQEAKNVRATGTVNVEVLISKSGKVLSACGKDKVHQSLIEAAEISAFNSTFSPATLSGAPVSMTGIIVYNFTAR